MLYDVSASVHVRGGSESAVVEADNEDDAKEKALKLGQKIIVDVKEIANNLTDKSIDVRVGLSNKNFLLKEDAIYLVSHYSKFLPARCTNSWCRGWGRTKYEHVLMYLGSRKRIILHGEHPKRIIKMLCKDGKINKPECKDCSAKFNCYTVR
jgi:hypothetical protein